MSIYSTKMSEAEKEALRKADQKNNLDYSDPEENINKLSDRELNVKLLKLQQAQTSYLKSIKNILQFTFYVFLILLAISLFVAIQAPK